VQPTDAGTTLLGGARAVLARHDEALAETVTFVDG
jgi:DNA-binding transcriptional LysR family regulator